MAVQISFTGFLPSFPLFLGISVSSGFSSWFRFLPSFTGFRVPFLFFSLVFTKFSLFFLMESISVSRDFSYWFRVLPNFTGFRPYWWAFVVVAVVVVGVVVWPCFDCDLRKGRKYLPNGPSVSPVSPPPFWRARKRETNGRRVNKKTTHREVWQRRTPAGRNSVKKKPGSHGLPTTTRTRSTAPLRGFQSRSN